MRVTDKAALGSFIGPNTYAHKEGYKTINLIFHFGNYNKTKSRPTQKKGVNDLKKMDQKSMNREMVSTVDSL